MGTDPTIPHRPMRPFYDMLSGGIKKNVGRFARRAENVQDGDLRRSDAVLLQFGRTGGTLDGSYPAHP
jgi:hypothetical protein